MRRLLFAACLAAAGCGSPPGPARPEASKVKGEVLFDGKPLPQGTITFEKNGIGPVSAGITDGKYEADAAVGPNRVTFAVVEKRDQPPGTTGPGSDQPALVNILPERYTAAGSTITFEVKPGPNTFDYLLKSK